MIDLCLALYSGDRTMTQFAVCLDGHDDSFCRDNKDIEWKITIEGNLYNH